MEPAGRARVERRLAAILAADVAGYSRLMGTDEEGTLAQLKSVRSKLVDPKIKVHRGRIVKTIGDGLLLEFASIVDACAALSKSSARSPREMPACRPIAASSSEWDQYRRHHQGRAGHLRRRRQCRGAARSLGPARWHLCQPGCPRPGA
jgi:hypothetical protein